MSELVGRLQAWRETVILPRWIIDDVKELVGANAQLKAELVLCNEQLAAHIDFVKQYQREVAGLESELALRGSRAHLRKAFDRAEQRMTRGLSPRRLSFRCSHCAKVTPLLLDGLIQALREKEQETA